MEGIRKNITLIIPALNEEGCIGQVLKAVPDDLVSEIIVVDGHSTDNTVPEAREALGTRGKVIIQTRRGFGGALYDAIDTVQNEVLVIMDADGSQNPADISRLLEKYDDNSVVMGSRYAKGAKSEDDTLIRGFGNWLFTTLTNLVHGTRVSDSLYFFFAISRENFKRLGLESQDYGICIEFLVKAKRAGLNFKEIPVIERPRLHGESKVNAFRDGLKILRVILRKY